MTVDQIRRIRECAFDSDIEDILEQYWWWSDSDSFDSLAQCLSDIRSILDEQ